MEKESLRADVQTFPFGSRRHFIRSAARSKNLNSITFHRSAQFYYEPGADRILESGGKLTKRQALRPFKGETRSMRSKEEAHDYR